MTVSDIGRFTIDHNDSGAVTDLRGSRDYERGMLAETKLSANQIRDNIRRLLGSFGFETGAFVVNLREDRDAA